MARKTKQINVADIEIHPDLQAREAVDKAHVADIAQAVKSKVKIKPPRVMEVLDRDNKLFAIDQHRVLAYKHEERTKIPAVVLTGTWQDARDLASSSNTEHTALKRSPADKTNAIMMCLEDHPDWTDSRIAKHVQVAHLTVASYRPKVAAAAAIKPQDRVGADNRKRTYTARVSKNGKAEQKEMSADDPDRFEPILELMTALSTEINKAINSDGGETLLKYLTQFKLVVYPNKVWKEGDSVEYRPRFKGFPEMRRIIRYAALPGRARTPAQVEAEFKRREDGE